MRFIETNEKNEKYYSVDCNKELLKDILEKLKNYGYVIINHCQMAGEITSKWPATESNIKKRVISFFNTTKKSSGAILYPESIVHHTENNSDYITYDYSSVKLPDLYHYIDLIINDRDIIDYYWLFPTCSNMFYAMAHKDQLILEGILNYVNSLELTNHNSINDGTEYDYEGLNELYRKTLECFKFNLIAIKEYLQEPEQVDILQLQRKK